MSKSKSANEKQVEHHLCLREIFPDFEDLCKVGGFRTTIRGKKCVLKFFIQYIVGDTAGHNDLTLHFQMNSGCRCCHYSPDRLLVLEPATCKPLTMKGTGNTNGNYHKLKAISQRHHIPNALYFLPCTGRIMGINGCTPWEILRTINLGLHKYQTESSHGVIGEKDAETRENTIQPILPNHQLLHESTEW